MTNDQAEVEDQSRFGPVQRCYTGSVVSQWLALRAGVLRRAVSQSGTALMRGARRVKHWLEVEIASAINRPRTPHLQRPPRTDRSRTLFGPLKRQLRAQQTVVQVS